MTQSVSFQPWAVGALALGGCVVALSVVGLALRPALGVAQAPQVPRPTAPRTTLGLLVPLGRLDPAVVRAFEERTGVNVRVDFAASGVEYETRIRSSPHAWDVVVADEQRLAGLAYAKLIKALPVSLADGGGLPASARPGAYAQGENVFVPLMADPLGIAWLSDSRAARGEPSWDWLVDAKANPLWRSRVALPADRRLQFLVAAAQAGLSVPYNDVASVKPALEWLATARHQARADGRRIEAEFLSGKAAAAVLWRSEYVRVRRLVPGLEFAVPTSGAPVERHGAALIADSFHEKEALALLAALRDGRGASARAAGLVPLEEAEPYLAAKGGWRLASESLPIVKSIEAELEKLR